MNLEFLDECRYSQQGYNLKDLKYTSTPPSTCRSFPSSGMSTMHLISSSDRMKLASWLIIIRVPFHFCSPYTNACTLSTSKLQVGSSRQRIGGLSIIAHAKVKRNFSPPLRNRTGVLACAVGFKPNDVKCPRRSCPDFCGLRSKQ